MNTNKTNNVVLRPPIRGRSRPFRSLFGAVAGALILTGFIVPRANATLIVYFNFEDSTTGSSAWDMAADVNTGLPGGNPGGGTQSSTLILLNGTGTGPFGGNATSAGGLLLNRTATDSDPAAHVPPSFNGQALLMNDTLGNDASLTFTVNTSLLTNLSLSFATDNNGNGFRMVELQYNIGGGFVSAGAQPLALMGQAIVTFSNIAPTVFTGNGSPPTTDFRLVFTGGTSNGNDRQTVIDNIQLNATVAPEPATVAGGLLGLFGLCWHQRRRLVRSLRLRHA